MEKNKLYVGNLSYNMTQDQLRDLFAQYGEIKSIRHFGDKGFGFVELGTEQACQSAIDAIHGTEVQGRKVTVNFARPPQPKENRPYQQRDRQFNR